MADDDHRNGMSRVQRELWELREKGLAKTQKDKYKDGECSRYKSEQSEGNARCISADG